MPIPPMPLGLLGLLRMGGAGTIPGPGNRMTSQAQTFTDPLAEPMGLMEALSSLPQGREDKGPVDGTGPLRTVNGVTMVGPAIRSLQELRQDLGLPIFSQVVSDYRTRAEQAELYRKYQAGIGNLAAPPGQSNHETGNAVDIASSWLSQNPQVRRWLLAQGWTNDVPGEPWHWEYGT